MASCDVIVVGAGPAGLFRVFELGLLGLRAHLLDSMPHAGGQCIELYPDKPSYVIPAIPVCSARELVERLQLRIRPFAPTFHPGHTVTALGRGPGGRFQLRTHRGATFDAGAVVIAGGPGAFAPRTLDLPGADLLVGRTLHYKVARPALFDGQDLVVAGGGDTALDWALALVDRVRSLVLVHRASTFRAAAATGRARRRTHRGRLAAGRGDGHGLSHCQDRCR